MLQGRDVHICIESTRVLGTTWLKARRFFLEDSRTNLECVPYLFSEIVTSPAKKVNSQCGRNWNWQCVTSRTRWKPTPAHLHFNFFPVLSTQDVLKSLHFNEISSLCGNSEQKRSPVAFVTSCRRKMLLAIVFNLGRKMWQGRHRLSLSLSLSLWLCVAFNTTAFRSVSHIGCTFYVKLDSDQMRFAFVPAGNLCGCFILWMSTFSTYVFCRACLWEIFGQLKIQRGRWKFHCGLVQFQWRITPSSLPPPSPITLSLSRRFRSFAMTNYKVTAIWDGDEIVQQFCIDFWRSCLRLECFLWKCTAASLWHYRPDACASVFSPFLWIFFLSTWWGGGWGRGWGREGDLLPPDSLQFPLQH